MKFENISVAKKLWFSVAPILLVMAGTGFVSQRLSAQALSEAMQSIQQHDEHITLAVKWKGMTETNTQRVIANALSTDPVIPQTFTGPLKQGIADIGELQKSIAAAATSAKEKEALAAVGERRTVVLDLLKTIDALKKTGTPEALGDAVNKQLLPAVAAYIGGLDAFIKVQEAMRDDARASAAASSERAGFWSMLTMACVFGLSMIGVALLARSISRPLDEAVVAAQAIARGDLTRRLQTTRHDEIGRLMHAMDEMASRLRGLVTDVREGVESVSTASQQIATGNQDLSARTEQTASNLQQTASSMEELTSTVSQSADTARQANQLASSAADAATRGGAVVGEVIANMERITDSSKKISDIIGVIDGIAFQTNILALNAAVEAARAGEQGRGFAVVASEVRALAQRSADAAKEIKNLIASSSETVESGARLVAQTGGSMQEIVASVRRVSDMINEITAAATEQRDGIAQVNTSVNNLDQMTQQNAALVEESAAAAQSLRDQAQRLAEVVSIFNVGARG